MKHSVDLHVHSHYSEGMYSIRELLDRALEEAITGIAVTDHNTIAGVPELLKQAPEVGIRAIAGIELYTHFEGHPLHLLGYRFDPASPALNAALDTLRKDNKRTAARAIAALREQGYVLRDEAIAALPSRSIGAIHLLREIERNPKNLKKLRTKLRHDTDDVFEKLDCLFGPQTSAHFPVSTILMRDAIQLIHDAGGLAVLAHPGQQLKDSGDSIIRALAQMGIDGIEVLSPYHTIHQTEFYQRLARELRLLMTGGSDFHGDSSAKDAVPIKSPWDYFKIPASFWEELTKRTTL